MKSPSKTERVYSSLSVPQKKEFMRWLGLDRLEFVVFQVFGRQIIHARQIKDLESQAFDARDLSFEQVSSVETTLPYARLVQFSPAGRVSPVPLFADSLWGQLFCSPFDQFENLSEGLGSFAPSLGVAAEAAGEITGNFLLPDFFSSQIKRLQFLIAEWQRSFRYEGTNLLHIEKGAARATYLIQTFQGACIRIQRFDEGASQFDPWADELGTFDSKGLSTFSLSLPASVDSQSALPSLIAGMEKMLSHAYLARPFISLRRPEV